MAAQADAAARGPGAGIPECGPEPGDRSAAVHRPAGPVDRDKAQPCRSRHIVGTRDDVGHDLFERYDSPRLVVGGFDTNASEHHHILVEPTGELIDIPASDIRVSATPTLPTGTELRRVDAVAREQDDAGGSPRPWLPGQERPGVTHGHPEAEHRDGPIVGRRLRHRRARASTFPWRARRSRTRWWTPAPSRRH